jgi:hypothetical protein
MTQAKALGKGILLEQVLLTLAGQSSRVAEWNSSDIQNASIELSKSQV